MHRSRVNIPATWAGSDFVVDINSAVSGSYRLINKQNYFLGDLLVQRLSSL